MEPHCTLRVEVCQGPLSNDKPIVFAFGPTDWAAQSPQGCSLQCYVWKAQSLFFFQDAFAESYKWVKAWIQCKGKGEKKEEALFTLLR